MQFFFVAFTDQFLFPVPLIHFPDSGRSGGSDDSLLISGNHIQMAKALSKKDFFVKTSPTTIVPPPSSALNELIQKNIVEL